MRRWPPDAPGDRAFAQLQAPNAIVEEILVATLEMTLSSRHLRDVSDDERHVSLLGADQPLGNQL